MSLNVRKALDVVKKFEMIWPDKQGNDAAFTIPPAGSGRLQNQNMSLVPRGDAFDKQTAGERLGLYKDLSAPIQSID